MLPAEMAISRRGGSAENGEGGDIVAGQMGFAAGVVTRVAGSVKTGFNQEIERLVADGRIGINPSLR
jgi:hypothetical protein